MASDNTLNVNITASVDGLDRGLVKAGKGVKKFEGETERLTKTTQKMGGAVKGAVPAMTSFSQVVQDAPYGIRGVANNIQQLTMQMGHLSKNAGGTKGALKAMIGTLAGPAGILLAVSVVTSLLVKFGDELFKSKNAVDDERSSLEKLNDTLRVQLNLRRDLRNAISDATKIAVLEAKLAGATAKEQFDVSKKWQSARIQSLGTQYDQALALTKKYSKQWGKSSKDSFEDNEKLYKSAKKNELKVLRELNDARNQLTIDGLNEQLRIKKEAEKNTSKLAETETRSAVTSLEFQLEEVGTVLRDGNAKLSSIVGGFTPISFIDKGTLTDDEVAFRLHLASMKQMMNHFNEDMKSLIQGTIANTFSDLGRSIGEALAMGENVMTTMGETLLRALGNFLGDMGEMLIAYGTLAITKGILDQVIATGGYQAIVAGALAIGVGVALMAISGAMGARANEGAGGTSVSSGASGAGGGTSSFSQSSISTGSTGGGTYVFEIEGTKLVGVLSNTLARNRALGGSLSII